MAKRPAFLVHSVPGRLRLKIPSERGNAAFFESLVEELVNSTLIEEATANPIAGSVIIQHESHTSVPEILREVADHLEVEDQRLPARNQSQPFETAQLSAWEYALSTLAIYQAARGRLIGPATENFWNAFGSQQILESKPLTFAFAAVGIYQLLSGNNFGSASSLLFYALILAHSARYHVSSIGDDAVPRARRTKLAHRVSGGAP